MNQRPQNSTDSEKAVGINIDWEDVSGVLGSAGSIASSTARRRPWEDMVVCRGSEPARASALAWPDRSSALSGGDSAFRCNLGGTWRALTCPRPEAVPRDAADPGYDDRDWPTISVPGHPELQGRGIPIYTNIQYPFPPKPPTVPDANPTTVYRRRFNVPESWAGRPLALEFAGTEPWLRLWIDGRELGVFAGGSRNPALFPIEEGLAAGEHVLVAVVPRWAWTTYIEDQDQWWLSGIFRPVHLLLREDARIIDWSVEAGCDGVARVAVETCGAAGGTIHAELCAEGGGTECSASAAITSEGSARLDLPVLRPRLWTAETPNLYRLLLRIEGTRSWYAQHIGFRSVELREGRLLINGAAIKIRGVNRHDAHPVLGRAITAQEIAADLRLIKRHGFNAVRTSHYPPQDIFFDLCDSYGLYVLAEADIESHGMKDALACDPAWREAFVDRCQRLVRRQRNRASVIAWSLGNESGMGPNIEAAAAAVRELDRSRPLQYHHGLTHPILDWVTMHYPRLDQIKAMLADPATTGRAILLEEYGHAMGNAIGSLAEHEELIDSEPRLLGGFIWEWSDHALWKRDNDDQRLAYGGDFGDLPNDGNFCIDGICSAERRIKPALVECAQVYAPLAVRRDEDGGIWVRSRRFHAGLDDIRLILRLRADGRVLREVEAEMPSLAPGAEALLRLPDGFGTVQAVREAFLEIEAVTRADTSWADAGQRLGVWQMPTPSLGPPPISPAPQATSLEAAGVRLQIDRAAAVVSAITFLGRPLVIAVPGLTLWRAPLDNDRPFLAAWHAAGLHCLEREPVECRLVDGTAILVSRWRAPGALPAAEEEQRWSLDQNGRIALSVCVRPAAWLPTLPRLGLRMHVDQSLATATWLGRGPHENLVDRCSAAWVAIHRRAVDDLAEPYVKPQEAGQRTGVRWWHLGGSDGSGLAVFGDGGLTVLARRCSSDDLTKAAHQEEVPRRPWIELVLDQAHAGTGNTSLRAERLPYALVAPRETSWSILLDLCSADEAERRWPRLLPRG